MILDAHCHIWESWPYRPAVPDPLTRARAEQLLFEMDANGVEHAVVICAAIEGNDRNADYAFEAARRHPGRLTVFPDIECRWSKEYRRPGAAGRLRAALDRWQFAGFTLYLDEAEDGTWLTSEEGVAFFHLAAGHGLIASLSVLPHQIARVVDLARMAPDLTILLHHFAFLGPRSNTKPDGADIVLRAAAMPNVFVKYSGMGNVAAPGQEFPYPELRWIPQKLALAFGSARMIWGSDYPVSRRHLTYAQTLSLLTRHGPFTPGELPAVLGDNMRRLLERQRTQPTI
jgi:L-fuconolactonase